MQLKLKATRIQIKKSDVLRRVEIVREGEDATNESILPGDDFTVVEEQAT